MSSTTTGAYLVSCNSGNKNNSLFCWILICLLPKFLGTAFAYINFLLIHAIDRSPSAVRVLENFDFSDVFGPLTVEVNDESIDESSELVYDDPEVIYTRSHSLVGPSSCISQSLKLGKLTIHESDSAESLELVEPVTEETIEDIKESNTDNVIIEESLNDEDGNLMEIQRVSIEDFEVLKVVGQGAFAKVYQVRKKGTSEIYAMKVMRKDKIMEKNHAEYMKAEREILTKIEHPFVVQLRYSFQTKYRLYLVLDFVNGGHLFFQLYHQGLFREDLARIYAAEIVSAVSHLHSKGIMHRDLKPENILMDADGHVMLTDFGLAKQFEESTRSNSMCGTLEYMAPEIILGKGHDKAADWWSVGILLFEMLTGKPPFCGGNREKIQQKIVKDKIKLPGYLSSEAHALLKGLLQKEASKRLGCGAKGIEEIKGHKWFKPINWKKLDAREIEPSFRPDVAGTHCVANFEKRWTDMPLVDSPAASPNGGNPFKDFSYVRPAASFLQNNSPAC
ncbi:Serine/threonine-protein kinase AtPK2/AtPK19 [Trifolium repens]|nr:Serine/threonine-protein kinase AtPK2/AtPK19 [Trifolium repens]